MKRFGGKICLVTGAATGIGEATALRLAQEGGKVACLDIDLPGAEGTAKACQKHEVDAIAVHCDVGSEEAVKAAVAQVVEHFGQLDVVCNIAGILRTCHTHEMSLELWDTIIRINLTGTFLMCREVLPHLMGRRGVIVNMSSTAAVGSHPWMAAYAASKGGVTSMTRALSLEYIRHKVRINAVIPGGIMTSMHSHFTMPEGGNPELLKGAMPHIRMAGPDRCASVVAFLASDDAKYIHGTEIRVDGGALS